MSLKKMKDRKVKQVLFRDCYQEVGGGHKEGVKKGKYDRSALYSCVKMEQGDLFKLF
jgi:hypothetical protein